MQKLRQHLFLVLATLIFLAIRIFASDPWTGAIATNDTETYVVTAQLPVFSTDFFSGNRPITLPLLYKLCAPPQGYDTSLRSEPSIGKTPGLLDLPGFRKIALTQSIVSVICWWLLAFALYRKLWNRWLKIIGVSLILLSACLPEIVSWDHVMMSESLSYSLFVLLLAFSLLLFDEKLFSGAAASRETKWLAAGFLATLFFWINTRDTNAYFLLVIFATMIMGFLVPFSQRRFHQVPWLGIIILITAIGIYGFQQASARGSKRLINPLINNLTANVFPYSTRVQFMHSKWGMPDSPEIISNTASANYSSISQNKEFVEWVKKHGLAAYTDFMINTPLWTSQMLIDSFSDVFGYYKQPYYDPWELKLPVHIKQLSRLIHWSSSDLILISLLLIICATARNLSLAKKSLWPIIWMMVCIWLGTGLVYSASYLGETWGSASRHIQNVILNYRLLLMVFIPILFDT